MNPPAGGNSGSDTVRGAGFAAAKGALLIGIAVIIGIVLLQQVDTGNSAKAGATNTTTTKPKTTTTVKHTTTTTSTTLAAAPLKTPAELRVIAVNGGAPTGAAKQMHDRLVTAGYTNQATQTNWSGHTQQGNSVLCKSGLDREAVALAVVVGQGTQAITPIPAMPNGIADGVDCVVVVGGNGSSSSSTTPTT